LYNYEEPLWTRGIRHVAGCDEVGRGPLAGPVVAAAVILNPEDRIDGLNDSKQLTERRREALAEDICARALAYHVTFLDAKTIDAINIYEASRQAMLDALAQLDPRPAHVLSDAMPLPSLDIPWQSIIKGDANSATIAAASILAKVARDHYMIEMDAKYPVYGFARHKGYPTKAHKAALMEHGPCDLHRRSYQPVQDAMTRQLTLHWND
jgi:ribonuclease HII